MDGWRRARLTAVIYDFGIAHERLGRLGGRLLWGADMRRFYRDLDRPRKPADGDRVLDVPCGGGTAFRKLEPGVRGYVALDLSPLMLRRARDRARRGGLHGIRFLQGDVAGLPLRDGEFDRCLSYFGLHCFPDPAAALAEMARVLRPRGRLHGTAVVRGGGPRQDALIRLFQRIGTFAAVGTARDLPRWLEAAGFDRVEVDRDGAVAYFSARRAP
ncbi:methyltransferase domain-containing protein [Sphaerisporangium sp. NPDC051011]|uniref:class I SAM-dependent methyltransferase n=1 Tax=Sphaerisporangium sp. NPDC051011 TaxID=3155792 RepID=UPI0033EA0372